MSHPIPDAERHVIDALAVATVAGTLMEWLPPIAAMLTIIWSLIRIWESDTVQNWIKKHYKS